MKTKLSVFAALILCLMLTSACALGATANASIVAPETVKVTAPFAGTLRPFDLTMGDAVEILQSTSDIKVQGIYLLRSVKTGAVKSVRVAR